MVTNLHTQQRKKSGRNNRNKIKGFNQILYHT